MEISEIMDFVVEHKFWFAVAVPFVLGAIVVKILG